MKRQLRGDLQGLRAVAVLIVIAAHAGVPFLPGGFVGVDVFYVISGFLITGLLCREVQETGSISLGVRCIWRSACSMACTSATAR